MEGWPDAYELLQQVLDLVQVAKVLGLPRKYEFVLTFTSCRGEVRMNRFEQEQRAAIEAAHKLYDENPLIEKLEIYGQLGLHVWTVSELHHCNELIG
ncbi:hypothetical protein ACE41H_22985 [Paenibacillus enshidis]|uniref:Uncharacterized protein n=1 Tax=Paenibacillus enshidis TaxID=1458439 RepID=A0ABV5AZI6_9BACL